MPRGTVAREGNRPSPAEYKPMCLVEGQAPVVCSQIVGVLRPDEVCRCAPRMVVLRVAERFAMILWSSMGTSSRGQSGISRRSCRHRRLRLPALPALSRRVVQGQFAIPFSASLEVSIVLTTGTLILLISAWPLLCHLGVDLLVLSAALPELFL